MADNENTSTETEETAASTDETTDVVAPGSTEISDVGTDDEAAD